MNYLVGHLLLWNGAVEIFGVTLINNHTNLSASSNFFSFSRKLLLINQLFKFREQFRPFLQISSGSLNRRGEFALISTSKLFTQIPSVDWRHFFFSPKLFALKNPKNRGRKCSLATTMIKAGADQIYKIYF